MYIYIADVLGYCIMAYFNTHYEAQHLNNMQFIVSRHCWMHFCLLFFDFADDWHNPSQAVPQGETQKWVMSYQVAQSLKVTRWIQKVAAQFAALAVHVIAAANCCHWDVRWDITQIRLPSASLKPHRRGTGPTVRKREKIKYRTVKAHRKRPTHEFALPDDEPVSKPLPSTIRALPQPIYANPAASVQQRAKRSVPLNAAMQPPESALHIFQDLWPRNLPLPPLLLETLTWHKQLCHPSMLKEFWLEEVPAICWTSWCRIHNRSDTWKSISQMLYEKLLHWCMQQKAS